MCMEEKVLVKGLHTWNLSLVESITVHCHLLINGVLQ